MKKSESKKNKISINGVEDTIEVALKQPNIIQTPGGPTEEVQFKDGRDMMQYIIDRMLESPGKITPQGTEDDGYVEYANVYDDGKGVFTKLSTFREPYRGFPPIDFVQGLDNVKKFTKKFFKDTFTIFKNTNKLKLAILLLLFRKQIERSALVAIDSLYEALLKFKLKPIMYSQAVKEVYRVFEKTILETSDEVAKIWLKKFQIIICTLFEFDNAYRYRWQDIIVELNLSAFKSDSISEIERLMNLLTYRELGFEKKKEYQLIKRVLVFYLKHNAKVLDFVVKMIPQISANASRLTKEDIAFCEDRTDYIFRFMQWPGWFNGKMLENYLRLILPLMPEFKQIKANLEEIKKAIIVPKA